MWQTSRQKTDRHINRLTEENTHKYCLTCTQTDRNDTKKLYFYCERFQYILFLSFPFFPLTSGLLHEQVLASRYARWIRTSLWRIVSKDWDFKIIHMGRGSNNTGNSHFNPQVEDLPRGYSRGYMYISRYLCFCCCISKYITQAVKSTDLLTYMTANSFSHDAWNRFIDTTSDSISNIEEGR